MPEVKITILLVPNVAYKGQSDPTWPTPPGVELRLMPASGAKNPVAFDATDADGVTSRDISPNRYSVEALAGPFHGWIAEPAEIPIEAGTKDVVIRLIPPGKKWLLPLHVYRYGDDGTQIGVPGAEIKDEAGAAFLAGDDGYVYATVSSGTATLSFGAVHPDGVGPLKPQNEKIKFKIDNTSKVGVAEIAYLADAEESASPLARISVEPTVKTASGATEYLTGATATIEYSAPAARGTVTQTASLAPGDKKIWFNSLPAGIYSGAVTPPANFNGWPVEQKPRSLMAECVQAGHTAEHSAEFQFEKVDVTGRVQTTDGRLVEQELYLEIYSSDVSKTLSVKGGTFCIQLDWGVPLKIRLAMNADLNIDGIPLEPAAAGQQLSLSGTNIVQLQYKYGIEGQAVDESGNPIPGAVIDLFDDLQNPAGSVAAGNDGHFIAGTRSSGSYYFAPRVAGGEPVTHTPVTVGSITPVPPVVFPSVRNVRNVKAANQAAPVGGDGDSGRPNGSGAREALTDLAAYPVLTEEVTTTGVPAPSDGGTGGGARGAGYGQAVDQAIRDVLGWRPGGDVAGFQAALTGAFQLRETEGHREWSWQQRGYAIQADMGALTGAQASIYARAKSALDQILPLLAGLTTLNPALYEPQDLETIRTVVSTELQELVNELALAGGPRIQRVNELFRLLVGENRKSLNINPELVQGQLGTLRQRFGLTRDQVQTVDEERIVTNFRIIVEQVLALQNSWYTDRKLLSGVSSQTSLGTLLIWLSRGLEAVCESVNDLTFSLDSVYVDAAQRQVVELRFANLLVKDVPAVPLRGNPPLAGSIQLGHREAPMFLSDLLDWVLRASRDEGPRIIQDAGKQGVFAFQPVLNTLRTLVRATGQLARERSDLPAGMRTPRVGRAIEVLAAQLDEAANLASLVRADLAPQVAFASINDPRTGQPPKAGSLATLQNIEIVLTGSNFRPHAKAVLIAEDHEDVPDLFAPLTVNTPSSASATFTNPAYAGQLPEAAGTTWLVSVINDDETQSVPVEVLRVPPDLHSQLS